MVVFSGCGAATKQPTASQDPESGRVRKADEVRKNDPKPNLAETPKGPFGLSMVATEDGKPLDIEKVQLSEDCADCHERQWKEMKGSLHSVSHTDLLYRRTAELALEEAGEAVYALCSGCHAPQGVAAGLIPGTPEESLPDVVKAGVVCDVCHQVTKLTGKEGPWGEPGNASIVLSPDEDRKFGPPSGNDEDATHSVETRGFLQKSEFCASCHTVIHPLNGIRIEHTYAEWKQSVYAEKGIQCQDCHMRTVEEAALVAEKLEPVEVIGKSWPDGEDRPVARHFFVGGNANTDKLSGSKVHARMAEGRLQAAARLDIEAPSAAAPGGMLSFEVAVTNVGAGHSLPTSLTELREMWVELKVSSGKGRVLFKSGWLEDNGDIEENAMRFGALAGDAEGNVTYKPWEVAQFLWKRLVPAKGTERDTFRVALPEDIEGKVRIEAALLYRSAPPKVVKLLLKEEAIDLKTVRMTQAEATIAVR